MKKLIFQDLTHRGSIAAEAFLLSAKILTEAEMRCRALILRRAGGKIYRWNDNLIVRLQTTARIDAGRSPGLPFVRCGPVLSAFPVEEKDLPAGEIPEESLIFLAAGALEIICPSELKLENIEDWFDLSSFNVIVTKTLGEIVQAPQIIKAVSEEDLGLRGALSDVPPADPMLAEILAKLQQFKETEENKKTVTLFSTPSSASGLSAALGGLFSGVAGIFASLFASGGGYQGSGGSYTKSGGSDTSNPEHSEPDIFSKFFKSLRNLSVKVLMQMRLGRIFGRRQAQYLAEMMEKFERGDLAEALKYAIPLEDMNALRNMMEQSISLSAPRPRTDLEIRPGQAAAGSTIGLSGEWFDHLRQLYRRSFERLEAQGRYEEAAFVLAELLKSNTEAVEFLAKHGKFRLAAELAEARQLPKEMIVRQWFLAGETKRAVRLAILHNCFEYAVARLEQSNAEAGARLREIWAESLAQSGKYSAAVDVIWKLEDKRTLARDWIEKCIESGGIPGARMLARKAILFPQDFAEIKEKFLELVSDNEPPAVERRAAFATALFKQTINTELQTLLRPLARRILSDAFYFSPRLSPKEFRELVMMSKDAALRTDMPAYSHTLVTTPSEECLLLNIAANDQGSGVIYDAGILPDGKIAVALGEGGIKIISRDGKTIVWFDQPAQKLIFSDLGNKAIAMIKRGETFRLARVDLIERRAAFWCDAKFDVYAPNFDGNIWFVGLRDEFYAIDVNAENFEALWHVPEVGAEVGAINRSTSHAAFLTLDAGEFETWWYGFPELVLRSRDKRKGPDSGSNFQVYAVNISDGYGRAFIVREMLENSNEFRFHLNIYDQKEMICDFDFSAGVKRCSTPILAGSYCAVAAYTEGQTRVYVFLGKDVRAVFTLESAQMVSTKFSEEYLIISDDCGRVLVYEYQKRVLRKNLRV